MMNSKQLSRHAPPRASAMIEALRGLGYSTATALADIVDNSITAKADEVRIYFHWAGQQSRITVLDNGLGMGPEELDLAMRLGERSPLEFRSPSDLGRFGLGLKTASFSQCRRLTVSSKKDGVTSCLRWDLDFLASCQTDDGWYLLEGPDDHSVDLVVMPPELKSGTLVVWEILDRVVPLGLAEQDFLDIIDKVEHHLSAVFHRYMEGPGPSLRISINGRPVQGWDPFLMANPSTWSSPVERLSTPFGTIEVQCHVLPHKDKLDSPTHESASGAKGWCGQQGFYLYRNRRLIVAGSWLELGHAKPWTQEEAYRLARIRLDIPNTADPDWKIDIRKSRARPPLSIRSRLAHLAYDTRERARRVFAARGQIIRGLGSQEFKQAWKVEHHNSGVRYRIDFSHPAVESVLMKAGELEPDIRAMLRIVEETVPIQRIWLDTTENREVPHAGFSGEKKADVLIVLKILYRNLVVTKGMAPDSARRQLLHTEPFQNFEDLVVSLPDSPE